MKKEDVIKAIKALHTSDPSSIETAAICTDNTELLEAAIEEFGSLGEAVRASGLEFFFEFEFNGLRLRSGRVEVARALLDWTEHHGPISSIALEKTAPELLLITNKLFGSLRRISKRLGLPLFGLSEPEDVVIAEPSAAPAAVASAPVAQKAKPAVAEVISPDEEEEDDSTVELLPVDPPVEGGVVECKVCGKSFKRLGLHLSRTHGLGVDEYRRGEW